MLGFIVKLFVLLRKVRDMWEWLNCMHWYKRGGAVMSRCGFWSVHYLEAKKTLKKHFGTKDSVRCSEFGGGRFSEVVNVLQVWDFQSVTRALSALGSVSASRSVRSGRFYCTHAGWTINVSRSALVAKQVLSAHYTQRWWIMVNFHGIEQNTCKTQSSSECST